MYRLIYRQAKIASFFYQEVVIRRSYIYLSSFNESFIVWLYHLPSLETTYSFYHPNPGVPHTM
jgi:hypothetical protein